MGVKILTVSVGNATQQEVSSLASGTNYYHHFNTFDELVSGAPALAKLFCDGELVR